MSDEASKPTRRRRRRATRAQGAPEPAPPAAPVAAKPVPAPPPQPPPAADLPTAKTRRRRPPREAAAERGLGDIVGAGRSQVGVSGALRARDVNRPTDEDLAEAERNVVIVRRNWKPPG